MNSELIEKVLALKDGGFCRDCADDGPWCPNRTLPCEINYADLRSLARQTQAGARAIETLTRIADHSREVLDNAKTLHYDMRGWAAEALSECEKILRAPHRRDCETGCVALSGYETRHDPNCKHYQGSLTEERDRLRNELTECRQTQLNVVAECEKILAATEGGRK